MNIAISSPHLKISETLEHQIKTKFTNLSKMNERMISCNILLKKEENSKQQKYMMEAKLNAPGKSLFAAERAETFEIALDKLIDDIKHQLRRHKDVSHAS